MKTLRIGKVKTLFCASVFAAVTCVSLCVHASGTTYYVAANGNDSAPGTPQTSPWVHAPGMVNCSGRCASTAIQAGDSIVFRGGDTWHFGNNALSPFAGSGSNAWQFATSGSATGCNLDAAAGPITTSGCIYIGVDPTWFVGSSWTRPVFDGDNPLSTGSPSSCAYNDTANVIWLNGSYVIVDNLEFRGYCWNNTNPWAGVLHLGDNYELKNSYFHGWTMASAATGCTSCDDDSYMSVMAGTGRIDHNVFDGSDATYGNMKATGEVFAIGGGELDHNVLNRVSNGIKFDPMKLVHDNSFLNMWEPISATHGNVVEWSGPPANSSTYYFNNLVALTNEGETIDMYPGASSSGKSGYIFNNVMTGPNGNAGNCYMIEGDNSGGPGKTQFFNNTSDAPCGMRGLRATTPPPATFQNNHFVGYEASALSTFAGGLTVTDNGDEIFQSESAANGQGYTSSNNYAPTGPSEATVGAGSNLTSLCDAMDNAIAAAACKNGYGGVAYNTTSHAAVDNPIVPRPSSGPWDVGAYQFGSAAVDGGMATDAGGATDGTVVNGGVDAAPQGPLDSSASDATAASNPGDNNREAPSTAQAGGCGCRVAATDSESRRPLGWLLAFAASCLVVRRRKSVGLRARLR